MTCKAMDAMRCRHLCRVCCHDCVLCSHRPPADAQPKRSPGSCRVAAQHLPLTVCELMLPQEAKVLHRYGRISFLVPMYPLSPLRDSLKIEVHKCQVNSACGLCHTIDYLAVEQAAGCIMPVPSTRVRWSDMKGLLATRIALVLFQIGTPSRSLVRLRSSSQHRVTVDGTPTI